MSCCRCNPLLLEIEGVKSSAHGEDAVHILDPTPLKSHRTSHHLPERPTHPKPTTPINYNKPFGSMYPFTKYRPGINRYRQEPQIQTTPTPTLPRNSYVHFAATSIKTTLHIVHEDSVYREHTCIQWYLY